MDREGSCRLPKKRTETVTLLEMLKTGQKDSVQRACIDSICSLLTEKEMQMMALLQLVADTPNAEEIIHQAAAVSQKVRSASRQKEMVAVPADTEKKRNFRSIFRKQQKKSAYALRREEGQRKAVPAAVSDADKAGMSSSTLLYSIEREIDNTTRNHENASHHVIGLVNNLLYYYRLEAGKEQPDKETFHPGRVIENVLHSFRTLAEKKGLGLTVETEGVNIMVEGDRLRLTQILNNLLTNAVKFTWVGYVHVGVNYAGGWLCFSVRDTGMGIGEDRKKNLFKAFERLDADNSQPGFGLGLSITARLVSLLGGTISVESREGHGSTFEVYLPMQETSGMETASVQRVEYACLSGLKAVLIDDDRIQADMDPADAGTKRGDVWLSP